MRHIKGYKQLFENYSNRISNTDTVYVAFIWSDSGPDYNFEALVIFRASDEEEARENFVYSCMGGMYLHDKNILDGTYKDFDEFIDAVLSDGYYSNEGWSSSGHLFFEFPGSRFMKIKEGENMITVDNEAFSKHEKKEEIKKAKDKLTEMVGPDYACQIMFRLKHDILYDETKMKETVKSKWGKLDADEKIFLAKFHPTLSPEDKRIYRAMELNMRR